MTLQLKVQAPKAPFAAAGSIPLSLTIRNTGGGPVEVPAANTRLPFEYVVWSQDGANAIQTASARQKQLAGRRGLVPRSAPEMQPLAAGGAMIYKQDLADLLLEPLPPGRYQLQAGYRLPGNVMVSAERVPLEIVSAPPAALAYSLNAERSQFIMVEVQNGKGGSRMLRKWESPANNLAMGQFRMLYSLPHPDPPASLALALEAEDQESRGWRWVAWTSGDALYAAVARAVDVKYPVGPIAAGLQNPVVLSSGYQYEHGGSLFAIAGQDQGKPKLRLVSFPADDEKAPEFRDVALPNVPPSPPEVMLSGPHLVLCWTLKSTTGSGVVVSRIDPATGAVASPPQRVFTTPRTIVASRVPALAGGFAFLLAPEAAEKPFTMVYLDPNDPSKRQERDLPAMTPLGGKPVERWVLASHVSSSSPVLAVVSGRLWACVQGGAWKDTGADAGAAAVRLWSLPTGQFWASWLDPERGYVFHRVG